MRFYRAKYRLTRRKTEYAVILAENMIEADKFAKREFLIEDEKERWNDYSIVEIQEGILASWSVT